LDQPRLRERPRVVDRWNGRLVAALEGTVGPGVPAEPLGGRILRDRPRLRQLLHPRFLPDLPVEDGQADGEPLAERLEERAAVRVEAGLTVTGGGPLAAQLEGVNEPRLRRPDDLDRRAHGAGCAERRAARFVGALRQLRAFLPGPWVVEEIGG